MHEANLGRRISDKLGQYVCSVLLIIIIIIIASRDDDGG